MRPHLVGNICLLYPHNVVSFVPRFGVLLPTLQLLGEELDIDRPDKEGWTPLMNACAGGSTEIVTYLLQGGADANAKSRVGRTPLHMCVHLMSRGNRSGDSCRWKSDESSSNRQRSAASRGYAGTIQELVRHAADVDATDEGGVLHPCRGVCWIGNEIR